MKTISFLSFLSLIIFLGHTDISGLDKIYIRASQVGYQPDDLKTAVILSINPLRKKEFKVITSDGVEILKGLVNESKYHYDKFKRCYVIDFSQLKRAGKYTLQVDGYNSYPFEINPKVFNRVVDSLILFFKVQRCGPTNPILHKPCHLFDVSRLINKNGSIKGSLDVTGGWHDAADYIKFFSTTAYTTYMLLLAYDMDKNKFGFDNDKSGAPDILEEARVGIDWLLRAQYERSKFITQVQDLRDHEENFRLPENDSLQYDRPGFVGISKNQVGIFAAVMALASKIWAERFSNYDLSKKCLQAAEEVYKIRNEVPSLDNSGTGAYQDAVYWGKLSLGAIELYNTTKKYNYLKDARIYSDSAGSDYWWSWGNINSLAQYRIAKYDSRFTNYLYNNLKSFNENKNKSIFNEGLGYTWGTTNSLLGVTLQVLLYKNLTGSKEFDSLAIFQRDYVLGRNPWGLTFISNIGSKFPIHFHSQIGKIKGYLPGALTAGPVPVEILKKYPIARSDGRYNYFNTSSVNYFDDDSDYISNEPTITGNATAVFVYGFYSSR